MTAGSILTIFCPVIIQLAWGKRRVSSRAKPGTRAYPEKIGATHDLWMVWITSRIDSTEVGIVVSAEGADHGAVYAAELAAFAEQQQIDSIKAVMTPSKIADLQEQRKAARIAKNFALADAIRQQIVDAGFEVNDAALFNGVAK